MTKLYTKTGDTGTTYGCNGRVAKDDDTIVAIGEIDELNSNLGLLVQYDREFISQVQSDLFTIGARLIGAKVAMSEDSVTLLELEIDKLDLELPTLKNFILPNGSNAACYAFISRAICRRAERNLVKLTKDRDVSLELRYLNRLSDYLFVLGRHLNYVLETDEVIWKAAQE
jgi:cob(I)alamin adenosyltransferase